MKKRLKYIDIAKGIAMILVIIGHCKLTPLTLKWWLYTFHMPLFFCLSGMVFNPDKYKNFKEFLWAKFKSLIIPYLCFCLILWTYTYILTNPKGFLEMKTLNKFIGIFIAYRRTKFYLSMWFIWALLFGEVLLYAFYRVVKKLKIKHEIILYIGFIILTSLIGYTILYFWKNGFYYSLDLVPISLAFITFGYVIRLNKEKFDKLYKIPFIIIFLVINIGFGYLNHLVCNKPDLYYSNMGNYFYYMISAIAGTLFAIGLSKKIEHSKVLEYIGRNSLIFYAFQQSIFIPIFYNIMKTLGKSGGILANQYFKLICVVVFTCISLAISSYIINMCFPWMLGKKKEKEIKTHKYKLVKRKVLN